MTTSPEELAKKLKDTAKLRETLMQRAILILEGASKEEVPVKTGHLRRTITSRAERDRGIVGTNAPYARIVHDGSRAHIIRPRNRKALAWPGAAHPVRRVAHPGTKPNKFFERAPEKNQERLERMAGESGAQFFSGVVK